MMQSGLYVSLSGQVALDRRMATIANNVANLGSAGYRAEELKFESLLSPVARETAFSSTGKSYLSERAGAFSRTGNALDVAIQGKGWLAVQTPQGVAYSKDGRLQVTDTGELQTVTGLPVLDTSFGPIQLDTAAGVPAIAHDGRITLGAKVVATLGLFHIDTDTAYLRLENSAIIPQGAGNPVTSHVDNGFLQGYVEGANVNPVTEMTNLITVTRAFEGLQSNLDETEASLKKAIQTLGG